MNDTATASGSAAHERFPRAPLLGAAFLVIFSLLAVTAARIMHWNATPLPPARVVRLLHLSFRDRADGAVEIRDVDRGDAVVQVLAPGSNNFIRGVLRGVARGRHLEGIGAVPPVVMTRWSDGRLTLDDPQTGQHLNLEVFGPTNAGAFAALFAADSSEDKGP